MAKLSKVLLVLISLSSIFNQLQTLSYDPMHTLDWKNKINFNYPKPWMGYVDRFIAKMTVLNSKFKMRLFVTDMLKFMKRILNNGHFVTYKYVKGYVWYRTEKLTEPALTFHMDSTYGLRDRKVVQTWEILLHKEFRMKQTFEKIRLFCFHGDLCDQKVDIISTDSGYKCTVCGVYSHLVIYPDGKDIWFVVTYVHLRIFFLTATFDLISPNIIVTSLIFPKYPISKVSYIVDFEIGDIQAETFHLVTLKYKLIKVQIKDETNITIYDGPGIMSKSYNILKIHTTFISSTF